MARERQIKSDDLIGIVRTKEKNVLAKVDKIFSDQKPGRQSEVNRR